MDGQEKEEGGGKGGRKRDSATLKSGAPTRERSMMLEKMA